MLPSKFRRILGLLVTVGPLAICALSSQGESAIAQESKFPAVLALRSAEREEQAGNTDEAERPRNLVRQRIFNKKPPKPWAIILCKFSDLATFEPYPVDYYEQCFTEFGAGTGRELITFARSLMALWISRVPGCLVGSTCPATVRKIQIR